MLASGLHLRPYRDYTRVSRVFSLSDISIAMPIEALLVAGIGAVFLLLTFAVSNRKQTISRRLVKPLPGHHWKSDWVKLSNSLDGLKSPVVTNEEIGASLIAVDKDYDPSSPGSRVDAFCLKYDGRNFPVYCKGPAFEAADDASGAKRYAVREILNDFQQLLYPHMWVDEFPVAVIQSEEELRRVKELAMEGLCFMGANGNGLEMFLNTTWCAEYSGERSCILDYLCK